MPSVGFEPAIPGSEEPQTHTLDRTAIEIHVKLVARNLKFPTFVVAYLQTIFQEPL
jgi:hypothetical protein